MDCPCLPPPAHSTTFFVLISSRFTRKHSETSAITGLMDCPCLPSPAHRTTFFVLISSRFTRKHSETSAITGATFFQLELRTQLFVWASYGDFYFSNFDSKVQYKVRSIGYHLLERKLVKRLLKVYNLSCKNMCEKLVGWKSLLVR